MGLEREFIDCANETVTVTPLSTHNDFGHQIYSSSGAVSYSAFLDPEIKPLHLGDGKVVTQRGMLYVMTSSGTIGEQDKLELADGSVPRMLAVNHTRDEEGQHHIEIAFG